MTATIISETPRPPKVRTKAPTSIFDRSIVGAALVDSLRKLDPRTMYRNPVMFIVEIGAVWSTVLAILQPSWFAWLTVFWLWLTVVFANLAEAVAEGRGKAQAETLRKAKADTMARRLVGWKGLKRQPATRLNHN